MSNYRHYSIFKKTMRVKKDLPKRNYFSGESVQSVNSSINSDRDHMTHRCRVMYLIPSRHRQNLNFWLIVLAHVEMLTCVGNHMASSQRATLALCPSSKIGLCGPIFELQKELLRQMRVSPVGQMPGSNHKIHEMEGYFPPSSKTGFHDLLIFPLQLVVKLGGMVKSEFFSTADLYRHIHPLEGMVIVS